MISIMITMIIIISVCYYHYHDCSCCLYVFSLLLLVLMLYRCALVVQGGGGGRIWRGEERKGKRRALTKAYGRGTREEGQGGGFHSLPFQRFQAQVDGKVHLKPNTGSRPIANKYHEGKVKRALKRVKSRVEVLWSRQGGPERRGGKGLGGGKGRVEGRLHRELPRVEDHEGYLHPRPEKHCLTNKW